MTPPTFQEVAKQNWLARFLGKHQKELAAFESVEAHREFVYGELRLLRERAKTSRENLNSLLTLAASLEGSNYAASIWSHVKKMAAGRRPTSAPPANLSGSSSS